MLYQITTLLLELASGLLTGACLLRLYMQYQRIPMSTRSGNPIGQYVFVLTDWLVLPLRRVIPALGRWDMASVLAAYLIELVHFSLEWALFGVLSHDLPSVLVLAGFGVVRTAILGMFYVLILYVVLSWVHTRSQISELLERLVLPVLTPIRRVVPLVGQVDLSALVGGVLLQIASIVLNALQTSVLVAI